MRLSSQIYVLFVGLKNSSLSKTSVVCRSPCFLITFRSGMPLNSVPAQDMHRLFSFSLFSRIPFYFYHVLYYLSQRLVTHPSVRLPPFWFNIFPLCFFKSIFSLVFVTHPQLLHAKISATIEFTLFFHHRCYSGLLFFLVVYMVVYYPSTSFPRYYLVCRFCCN